MESLVKYALGALYLLAQAFMPMDEDVVLTYQDNIVSSSEFTGMDAPGHFDNPSSQSGLECLDQPYQLHIFSREPLMIYIENFLSVQEAIHLIDQA